LAQRFDEPFCFGAADGDARDSGHAVKRTTAGGSW
jgi:hypothetical protein